MIKLGSKSGKPAGRTVLFVCVERLPFGLLFLLGGGLALSQAFISSGLANWLASSLSVINVLPFEIVVALVVSLIMSISNVKSNTAAAAVFIPVIGNMAILNGVAASSNSVWNNNCYIPCFSTPHGNSA